MSAMIPRVIVSVASMISFIVITRKPQPAGRWPGWVIVATIGG